MPQRPPHDTSPPTNWPESIQYLIKSRLSPNFPTQLIPFISQTNTNNKFTPHPTNHPNHVLIRRITLNGHPAFGQNGLYAKSKISGGTLILPYLGIIHASFISGSPPSDEVEVEVEEEESDYDLSLLRISASDPRNPFPGKHVSIGVDADKSGNAGRMVNDYRGVAGCPNSEFRVGKGEGGDLRMELWTLKEGVKKGDEILVSYGKGWWGARKG